MSTGYSRSPKLQKGAFVVLDSSGLIGFVPRAIAFQYNPTSISRTLNPVKESEAEDPKAQWSPKQPYDPEESFSLKLVLDAADAMERPDESPLEAEIGVAARLAALEQLLYPVGTSMSGIPDVLTVINETRDTEILRRPRVPVILFSWGASRLLPVRLSSYSVDEKAYNPMLQPIHAEVTVKLTVITPGAFGNEEKMTKAEMAATAAYFDTMQKKEMLALSGYESVVDAIIDNIPGL